MEGDQPIKKTKSPIPFTLTCWVGKPNHEPPPRWLAPLRPGGAMLGPRMREGFCVAQPVCVCAAPVSHKHTADAEPLETL